jgi:hypothetical protein
MKNRIIQAYKQAPWRIQIQWIGLFLLGLVLIASTTGLYLNISAQAAGAGRNVQSLEYDIDDIHNEIAALRSDLAKAKSTEKMLTRAEELGYKMLNPSQAVYLEIPGFDPNQKLVLAPTRLNTISEAPSLQPSYTLSLWEWMSEKFWRITPDTPIIEGEQTP